MKKWFLTDSLSFWYSGKHWSLSQILFLMSLRTEPLGFVIFTAFGASHSHFLLRSAKKIKKIWTSLCCQQEQTCWMFPNQLPPVRGRLTLLYLIISLKRFRVSPQIKQIGLCGRQRQLRFPGPKGLLFIFLFINFFLATGTACFLSIGQTAGCTEHATSQKALERASIQRYQKSALLWIQPSLFPDFVWIEMK